jgi:hypothetical protein
MVTPRLAKRASSIAVGSRRMIAPPSSRSKDGQAMPWARYSDEQLLNMRMCDLGVKIKGTVLEQRITRLHDELQLKGLGCFRPHC